mgnify:CR=1 FL=1
MHLLGKEINGFEEIDFSALSDHEQRTLLKNMEEVRPDFLGETYNLIKRTRQVTEKTQKKLNFTWDLLEPKIKVNFKLVTARQFFCLVGLLIHITGVLNIQTYGFFNLIKKLRRMSGLLSEDETLWDKPLPLDLTVQEYIMLSKWVEEAKINKPVSITAGDQTIIPLEILKADIHVIQDASGHGWGAVLFNEKKQYMFNTKGKWPDKEKEYYSASVRAEAQGIEETIGRIKHLCQNKTVAILTDHENIVFAARAMFVHNFFYNKCIQKLRETEKQYQCRIILYFLKGIQNNADGISRGGQLSERDKVFPNRTEGMGSGTALTPPWQT